MVVTPFAWILVILAFIVGFLAAKLKLKRDTPALETRTIKATDANRRASFTDAAGNEFIIELPVQDPARDITFWKIEPTDLKNMPNPNIEPVSRVVIHLKAKDAFGEVENFNPPMTTIVKYTTEDLAQPHVGNKPENLIRFYHTGKRWIRLAKAKNAIDPEGKTITAYVSTFSSCGI